MQRPKVGICRDDNLEDCLAREKHKITFALHGGAALIKFLRGYRPTLATGGLRAGH